MCQGLGTCRLHLLDLSDNCVTARGVAHVLRVMWPGDGGPPATLRVLELCDNPLGAEGVAALCWHMCCHMPRECTLERLSLARVGAAKRAGTSRRDGAAP